MNNRQTIKLTEEQLNNIVTKMVTESVKRILNESTKNVVKEQANQNRLGMLISQIASAQKKLQSFFQSNPNAEFDLSIVSNALNNSLQYLRSLSTQSAPNQQF